MKKSYHESNLLLILFVSLFIVMVFLPSAVEAAFEERDAAPKEKVVLLLNSYNADYTWTANETEGVKTYFYQNLHGAVLHIENLDWKNYNSEEYVDQFKQMMKLKYSKVKFDAIIATDDAAVDFAVKYKKELFYDAPLVFCGIYETQAKAFMKKGNNIAGVIESIDPAGTVKAILKLQPETKTIYVFHDETETGLAAYFETQKAVASINKELEVIPLHDTNFNDFSTIETKFKPNSVALLSVLVRDSAGNTTSFEKITEELSKKIDIPLYSLYHMSYGFGTVGGSLLSGYAQGETAAELVKDLMTGKEIHKIGLVRMKDSAYQFDYKQLIRFNLDPRLLPAGSGLINKPFSFYESYKNIVWGTVSVFFLLGIYIILLRINIRKRKAAEEELRSNNMELASLYEQIAASEEVLRDQYDELEASKEVLQKSEEKVRKLAYFDSITELPNRVWLSEKIESVAVCNDYGCNQGVVFLIDTDNFKLINDTFGHKFGDQLLKLIGERLRMIKEECYVGRIGGDEFMILLESENDRDEIELLADKIMELFTEPFQMDETEVRVSVSVGISIYPEHGHSMSELLKNVDMAMYKAKEKGKNRYCFYEEEMKETIEKKVYMGNKLREAIYNKEFELYYQPQVDLRKNEVIGFEALIRWNSPDFGFVSPGEFIPLAEDMGLIDSIGAWVLEEAADFSSRINESEGCRIGIGVNISAMQLARADFVKNAISLLDHKFVRDKCISLEITESVLMESFKEASEKLEELRAAGIRISLDDFGTGYSSLSYLEALPIDFLKIDKSFIDKICEGSTEINLVSEIIEIAHKLELTVIAEGVETEYQVNILRQFNCDCIQGYYFSRPMKATAVSKYLSEYGKS